MSPTDPVNPMNPVNSVNQNTNTNDSSGDDDTGTMKTVSGRIHPVYVLGMDNTKLAKLRSAYTTQPSSSAFNVGFYRIQNYSILSQRVGLEPSVVIMMEHIHIEGDVYTFLKRYHTPVLRVMKNPCEVSQLAPEYYYGGVYDTCSESDLFQTKYIQYHVNLGVMVWARNVVARRAMSRAERDQADSAWDPRGSRFRKRITVPAPEPSWYDFVNKYGTSKSNSDQTTSSSVSAVPA